MAFQLVQILYWLALSTWFGGVLFIALAAPVVFHTMREANPVLPNVLSVNLEGQHGTLLAGSIVGALLSRLATVQLICAAFLLLTTIAQFFLADMTGPNLIAAILRILMLIAAAMIVFYDSRIIWPRLTKSRDEYIQNADDPDIANPAKEQFDKEHRLSVTLLQGVLFLLLGMILFSGNIAPTGHTTTLTPHAETQTK